MQQQEYKTLFDCEDDYWWYVGLHELLLACLKDHLPDPGSAKVLDAGCGTGGMLKRCDQYNAFGVDYSSDALRFCQQRGLRKVARGSLENIPYQSDTFAAVISLDVLSHVDQRKEAQSLDEIFRVTKDNGIIVLNLPAYEWLRSTHDKAIQSTHRYTLPELKEKMEKAGFKVKKITYRNTFLFPIIVVVRLMGNLFPPTKNKISSDLKPIPAIINKILTQVLRWENQLIRRIALPFGLSNYCIAQKVK